MFFLYWKPGTCIHFPLSCPALCNMFRTHGSWSDGSSTVYFILEGNPLNVATTVPRAPSYIACPSPIHGLIPADHSHSIMLWSWSANTRRCQNVGTVWPLTVAFTDNPIHTASHRQCIYSQWLPQSDLNPHIHKWLPGCPHKRSPHRFLPGCIHLMARGTCLLFLCGAQNRLLSNSFHTWQELALYGPYQM
jgi:hypothetical protein